MPPSTVKTPRLGADSQAAKTCPNPGSQFVNVLQEWTSWYEGYCDCHDAGVVRVCTVAESQLEESPRAVICAPAEAK